MFRSLVLLGSFLASCAALPTIVAAQEDVQVSTPVQSVPEKPGWELVWSDEFDGTEIDEAKWSREVDCWGGGNEERQCYTDNPMNAFVDGGVLYINALLEPTTGFALPESMRKTKADEEKTKRQPFTSARLNTKGKADWTYGRFEVRAKMPLGQGMWPAIWMLPAEDHYGSWAASGEIDILEAVNWGAKCKTCDGKIENRVIGTIHYGGEWPHNKYKGGEAEIEGSIEDFHVYAVEWKEGEITWFVNDREYLTLTSKDWKTKTLLGGKKNASAPFDRPFYLIMNVAVGGHLPEAKNEGGLDLKNFPKSMEVDWVRVYQRPEIDG